MNQKGFSLLELVLALAVGSIIVGVGLGSMRRMENSSRTRQTASDMAAIREAGLRYYWRNNSFPSRWSQLSGYLPPRLVNNPRNPYGYSYVFTGSGVRFQVFTAVPKSVPGNLGLEQAIRRRERSYDTITTSRTAKIGNIGGVIYERDTGWSG